MGRVALYLLYRAGAKLHRRFAVAARRVDCLYRLGWRG
jgi:hypothetical protein